ncbi:Uu.00g120330.m01.CDS01 [Anthostomella pinea]|uniref:Uu.00g120330.m01.CDS01 n=1 Tax=Anthostomella pinea TaxID=933095 RepID=A0AAI8VGQ4_9PEZI|nr:Uu.00g120330.m01.CDS01 [Anthostomella pinea]
MCRNIKTLSVCPTCNKQLSENTNKQWCRDARRHGHFGRCSTGVRKSEDEFRGEECKGCAEVRENAMNELDLEDFAEKRLGWHPSKGRGQAPEDSDGEYGYGW